MPFVVFVRRKPIVTWNIYSVTAVFSLIVANASEPSGQYWCMGLMNKLGDVLGGTDWRMLRNMAKVTQRDGAPCEKVVRCGLKDLSTWVRIMETDVVQGCEEEGRESG